MAACCPVAVGRATGRPWLTDPMVKYYAGGWTVQELAAIEQELDRQQVRYTIDGDDLLVHDDHQERRVDMIIESITES
jgi:flagellar biosynthesis/type III secretory pathway M-ring protein FliF/YscJ